MQRPTYLEVPLTEDDKDMLFTIYDARRRLFLISYMIIILIGVIYSFKIDSYVTSWHGSYHRYVAWTDPEHRITRKQMILINIAFVETMIIGTAIAVYTKRIHPYSKDLKLGIKARIPYTIIRKQYFPLTNQYYVGFDDPNYLHHEIDEDTYNQVNVGDVMYIYRAIQSKYTFEQNGRFSLM